MFNHQQGHITVERRLREIVVEDNDVKELRQPELIVLLEHYKSSFGKDGEHLKGLRREAM